jgi:hypothetical protein
MTAFRVLERTGEEVVIAYLEVLFWKFLGETEKPWNHLVKTVCVVYLNQAFTEYMSKVLPLEQIGTEYETKPW